MRETSATISVAVAPLLAAALLLTAAACDADRPAEHAPPEPADQPQPATEAGHQTPEQALRSLLLGLIARDEQQIRHAILPDDDAEILWHGDPPADETRAPYQAMLEQATVRTLEPGETVPLPGGREHELTDQVIDDDRRLALAEHDGQLLMAPVWVVRTQAGWRVDAGPIIGAQMLRNLPPDDADHPE